MKVLAKAQIRSVTATLDKYQITLDDKKIVIVSWQWWHLWRPKINDWLIVTEDQKAHLYVPKPNPDWPEPMNQFERWWKRQNGK